MRIRNNGNAKEGSNLRGTMAILLFVSMNKKITRCFKSG